MNAAFPLAAALALAAVPARAAAAPVAPANDQKPYTGLDNGDTMYSLSNFDAMVKVELKQRENAMTDELSQLQTQYDSQKELETRQQKEKFDFLKKLLDDRAAFERDTLADWKKFVARQRTLAPDQRYTEKQLYDQKIIEKRHAQIEDAQGQDKQFMDKQQRERDEFWAQEQKNNNERERVLQEKELQAVKEAQAQFQQKTQSQNAPPPPPDPPAKP